MTLSEKKNRGEWSELYALTSILATGKIQTGNASENVENTEFPIVSVSRKINGIDHIFRIEGLEIEVLNTSDQTPTRKVSRSDLSRQSELLLSKIQTGKGRSFPIPEAAPILLALGLDKVAGNGEKTDLTITTYDSRVKRESEQGFSIKSFIGSKPTLLNASGVTNIEYTIQQTLTELETESLNKLGPIDLVSELDKNDFDITPSNMDPRFEENLKMIDSEMDKLLAQIVLASYEGRGRTMKDIVNILVEKNPLKYTSTNNEIRYTHKIKDLLEAVALGMRPSESWTGQTEADGGNLIVTSEGTILCHHALYKDSLRTYLFDNTFIDTPSRRRHKFGSIVKNVLTLNFQIRFK
jgi:hypothetical protein